ncbi:unnamed protein product [Oikopleura dioica]|uniref:Protein kinase domain-containing protein n=1 Tax=Oikopleura dioica TaxID=34765 RepID=E4XWC9_OIKDI|nr:unnamed protein product [Oikopleura dioica]
MAISAGRYNFLRNLQEDTTNIHKLFWLVKDPNDNNELVLKSAVNKANTKVEYEIMIKLDHKNIIKVIDCVTFTHAGCEYFGISMKFMRNGDLEKFIISKKNEIPLNWTQNDALRLIVQFIAGLSYLHEREIIHRDLKPSNIFLGPESELVIGDFGISDSLQTTRMTRVVGTDNYLPPEAIEEQEEETLSFSRDIWGCGVVIYMISYLKHPFTVASRRKTIDNICEVLVKIHENENRFIKCDGLIRICLQKAPENRVPNGSILSKNRSIENLIYQLKSGIPPSQFNFSENIADVLQSVNAKLLRDISQLRKSHEETTKELQEIKTTKIYSLEGQLNGLDFYFGNDKYTTRNVIMKSRENTSFSIRSIFKAVDLGLRRINLKFYWNNGVDSVYKKWRVRSPARQKKNGEYEDWELAISNSERRIKFRTTAENIRPENGEVSLKVEGIESISRNGPYGEEAIVTCKFNISGGYIRWNIEFLE